MDALLDAVADAYGVNRRELTIGQIEDWLVEKGCIREKGAKRELPKENINISPAIDNTFHINNLVQNPSTDQKTAFADEFESLWERYPRKAGKKDALRHYTTARKRGVPFETISNGVDRYVAYIKRNGVTPQYIKMGSSWFSQEAWNDELQDKGTTTRANTFHNFDERNTNYDELIRQISQ